MKTLVVSRGKEHFIIKTEDGLCLQVNDSIIAFSPHDSRETIQLDENKWDSSTTIDKHRNEFLLETKTWTEKKIASGEYVLTNLN